MAEFVLILFTLLSGLQQGIITWLFREFVPMKYQDWIDAALHKGGMLIYLTMISYTLWVRDFKGWFFFLVTALAIRVIIFDPALNLTQWWFSHREGRTAKYTPFSVGTSASSDRAVIWLGLHVGLSPVAVRVIIWLLSSVLAGWMYFYFRP